MGSIVVRSRRPRRSRAAPSRTIDATRVSVVWGPIEIHGFSDDEFLTTTETSFDSPRGAGTLTFTMTSQSAAVVTKLLEDTVAPVRDERWADDANGDLVPPLTLDEAHRVLEHESLLAQVVADVDPRASAELTRLARRSSGSYADLLKMVETARATLSSHGGRRLRDLLGDSPRGFGSTDAGTVRSQLEQAGFADVLSRGSPPPIVLSHPRAPIDLSVVFTAADVDLAAVRDEVTKVLRDAMSEELADGIREARTSVAY